jgi:hypothetical protein
MTKNTRFFDPDQIIVIGGKNAQSAGMVDTTADFSKVEQHNIVSYHIQ